VRSFVSNSIYAKKDRNGSPSANQVASIVSRSPRLVASKDEPRRGHAVYTHRVHPPIYPCPALSAHVEHDDITGGGGYSWSSVSLAPDPSV